ncbi:phage scaffolding protein [Acidisoma sp. 7E03]
MTPADLPPAEGETETVESLRARAADLERQVHALAQQARDAQLMAELKAEALRAGMVDLDGLKLLDTSGLTVTDQGEVPGSAAVMERFRREKPWLFAAPSSATAASPPPAQPPRAKRATDMTAEEYRAARAAITRRF